MWNFRYMYEFSMPTGCVKSYGVNCMKKCFCLNGTCDQQGYCPQEKCQQNYFDFDCSKSI